MYRHRQNPYSTRIRILVSCSRFQPVLVSSLNSEIKITRCYAQACDGLARGRPYVIEAMVQAVGLPCFFPSLQVYEKAHLQSLSPIILAKMQEKTQLGQVCYPSITRKSLAIVNIHIYIIIYNYIYSCTYISRHMRRYFDESIYRCID